jgi:AbrB family looped-hinge helix DNA binding protein
MRHDRYYQIWYYSVMSKMCNLTVKGQVTIPKDVRDDIGLKPGEPVAFVKNENGDYVVRKGVRAAADHRRRYEEALRAIDEALRRYPPRPLDMTTDEYMAMIREPLPEPRSA